jgi:hypothetical protein
LGSSEERYYGGIGDRKMERWEAITKKYDGTFVRSLETGKGIYCGYCRFVHWLTPIKPGTYRCDKCKRPIYWRRIGKEEIVPAKKRELKRATTLED